MSEPRTVTLQTLDRGEITIPEPAWCIGHQDRQPEDYVDTLHLGPDVELRFHGHLIGTAGLVQSPLGETLTREVGVSVSLLSQTLDPVALYSLAATLDAHADELRSLADQLDTLLGGGQ